MSLERSRLTLALLLSLLIHTLLLSLTFGGQGLGLPGFAFPWRDRRIEAPDLRVALVPAQVTTAEPADTPVAEPAVPLVAEPLQQAMGRAACFPWAGDCAIRVSCVDPDAIRRPCADPGADGRSARAGNQADVRGQSKDRQRGRCAACENTVARRSARRSTLADTCAGRDRLGAARRTYVDRARHSNGANSCHRRSAKRLEPGIRDAAASRYRQAAQPQIDQEARERAR